MTDAFAMKTSGVVYMQRVRRRQAEKQARYRARLRDKVIVVRLPIAQDTLLDLVHSAGIVVPDPSRSTLAACLGEFVRLFEAGLLRVRQSEGKT
jgi:hypothetical protein